MSGRYCTACGGHVLQVRKSGLCARCQKAVKAYTLADVGCYVDGARGIYAIDRIVEIAVSLGMAPPGPDDDGIALEDELDHQMVRESEVEDEADEYMNAHHAVDGAFWGRSDQGDWGLWPVEEENTS